MNKQDESYVNLTKTKGMDRSHAPSLFPKIVFFFLHLGSVLFSAYLIWGGGFSIVGSWFGLTWKVVDPFRTQVVFGAV